ncbi:MAG: hypothetical protein K2G16_03710 [Lachnospiraceae bacterium]|nr:hypothetical protein [Lachnospiraceae bacterium]
MTKVIGVRFRTAGKIYFFDPLDFQVERGGHVIVETARGIEFGTVVSAPKEVEDEKIVQPLKPVLRIANQRDIEQEADNKRKEKEAYKICLEKIRDHGLEMKLIDAEYTFDNNKVLFYFTADGRIDFRELVKDLASVFKTRIELRQVGVRDETKIVGGIGICGRPLCCHTHLSEFIPVSIKMAKEQNLSLNPTKISGVCGRLMCCLKHEEETYEELNRRLPNTGDYVTTADGLKGEVQSVNVLRQRVKVIVDVDDEKEIREYKVEDLRFKRMHGKKENLELSAEELKELEKLEAEEELEAVEERSSEKPVERSYKKDFRQDKTSSWQDKTDRAERTDRNRNRKENYTERAEESERQYQDRKGGRNNRGARRDNRQEGYKEDKTRWDDNRQERRREDHTKRDDNRQERRREDGTRWDNSRSRAHREEGEERRERHQRDSRPRNRQNYRSGKKEGKTNFEGNYSEGKGTP